MKKITVILFMAAFAFSSCKKQLNINQNPNQPTSVTPDVVLAAALVGTAGDNAVDYLGLTRWMGFWSRSGNYVPDVQTETYNIANDYTDGEWGNIYVNLNNYDYIEKVGHAQNLPFYVGVAKVMKAYGFGTLVDIYSDVPYSDCFKPATDIKPTYDKGPDIYNDLLVQLDSAAQYFEDAKAFYSIQPASVAATDDQHDIMFGSARTGAKKYSDRLDLWVKFVNTVELRLLMHLSQVGAMQSIIQSKLMALSTAPVTHLDSLRASVSGGPGFIGANESAAVNPGYQASGGKISPLYGVFYKVDGTTTVNYDYYRANSYAVNFYLNTGDERQAFLYAGTSISPGSNFDGDPASVPNTNTAGVGAGLLKGFNQDQFIFSDFESLFLQAEAVQRGYIVGDAQSLYESAVIQNYIYLVVPSFSNIVPDPVGDAQFYLSQGVVDADWAATPDKLELILTQKWAAMNGVNWVEAYTDYRRTGFPNTTWLDISHSPSHVQPQIPVRYLYPQSEYNTNGSNVPQLGANAQFTAKVFWNQ
ncbi:MAG: SusD/RagB family nutrient-binding outer membrane lipoprotein [Chitinophagales bacterium]